MPSPPPAVADLTRIADALRLASRRAAGEIILIGTLLGRVRAALPRGEWLGWCQRELGWPTTTVYRLLGVGQAFGALTDSHVGKFEASALYALSQPGVPPSARAYAVELAGDGHPVTRRVALDILDAYRPPKAIAPVAGRRPPRPEPPAPVPDAPAWAAALRAVMADASMLHVTRSVDEETGEEYFCGRLYRGGSAHPETAAADSVEEVLVRLAGREESRRCPRCGAAKAMREFRRNRRSSKGREHQCRECAKKRQAARRAKRKAAQEA